VLAAQKLEQNGIMASPHPAISPDLAPSDFFTSAVLRDQLPDHIFESADELIDETCEMTSPIPGAKLETVFVE
jgi:hypothetical protein